MGKVDPFERPHSQSLGKVDPVDRAPFKKSVPPDATKAHPLVLVKAWESTPSVLLGAPAASLGMDLVAKPKLHTQSMGPS